MKSVQLVASGHILGLWETVWPMLNVAFINYEHGDYNIEQLKVLLIKEFQLIFVVVEEVIPETQQDKNTDIAALGLIGGFIVMMTLDVALG